MKKIKDIIEKEFINKGLEHQYEWFALYYYCVKGTIKIGKESLMGFSRVMGKWFPDHPYPCTYDSIKTYNWYIIKETDEWEEQFGEHKGEKKHSKLSVDRIKSLVEYLNGKNIFSGLFEE